MVASESFNNHGEVAAEVGWDKSDVGPTVGEVASTISMCEVDPPGLCELCCVG